MVKMNDIQIKNTFEGQVGEKHMGEIFVSDHWTVMLTYESRVMILPFYMGSGYKGSEPTVKQVLDSLLSDYYLYYNSRDMYEFAGEVGIEEDDQERIEKEWKEIKDQSEKLEYLLGEDGIEILNEEIQAV